jgi:anti-anti-sigma regulatory factor
VFGLIGNAGLGGVVGVSELLFFLRRVSSVGSGGGEVRLSEIPVRVERLIERLGLDILPKAEELRLVIKRYDE